MYRYKNNIVRKRAYRERITILVIRLVCICFPLFQSQTTPLPEYKIKAVFLFNFTQFVAWPDNAFSNDNDPFVIGILGKDPFGNYMNEAIAGEKMGSHPLTIAHYQNINEIGNCQMLFISNNGDASLPAGLPMLTYRGILTVSDIPGFAQSGGMIEFVTINNKIKLQINPAVSKAAGLSISSKLLSVADIVK